MIRGSAHNLKRTRESNIKESHDSEERASKKSVNVEQSVSEIAKSSNKYLDSGVKLTYVVDCTAKENIDTVKLKDIIGDENLEELYQFNFTVDLEYLMSNLAENVRSTAKVHVIHGMRESAPILETSQNSEDGSSSLSERKRLLSKNVGQMGKNNVPYVKVAIVTANICYADWNNMCQAAYQTPIISLKSIRSTTGILIGSEHGSPFERDLLTYFRAYRMQVTDNLCAKLEKYDFSECKAVIIGSTPGYHKGEDMQNWGLKRLQYVLTKKVDITPECQKNSIVLTQMKSLEGEYGRPHDLAFAGFLRMAGATYQSLHNWFPKYLCKWAGKAGGRERAMPHYKSYTRLRVNKDITSDSSENDKDARASIAWHLVTSANLSRAAWGDLQKNGSQLHIRHYELGVLIYPDLWEDGQAHILVANHSNTQPLPPKFISEQHPTIIPVRIPYGLPPAEYTKSDHCWTTAVVDVDSD
ncbi:hypothetical protein INT43_004067 [Umbelopsis isabellina]|uniref:Tyrosyl-DNA phosphodiesterase n=1 Tax=Mortierella isabellina TaxID=91625 RepID=A0A8H7UHQ6_MORIS|nr:hypothetical protein INT43_004067 [Umbelopsis isabellina]